MPRIAKVVSPKVVTDTQPTTIKHLACIMDGNRRWAKKKGWQIFKGHREGVETVKRTAEFCLKKGIPVLSLYTFSLENFSRPEQERSYLFNLIIDQAASGFDELIKKGVRVRFIGDRTKFPHRVALACDELEKRTKNENKLLLNVLFCYGGQQEIVAAVQKIARTVKAGGITEKEITPEFIKACLWLGDVPDPDLIIRTGGVQRLSNFLTFQSAYSEMYFLDCLWPELTEKDLERSVEFFENTKRNFGR